MIIGNLIVSSNISAGSGTPSIINTSANNEQAFLIIGDSIAAGRTTGTPTIPTASSGTLYEWNNTNSSLTELTTADVSTASTGSPWKQFGIEYNATFGKKVVLVARGSAGSNFYPDGDTNNWYTSGTLYDSAKTATTNCLANLGVTHLKGILMILGVNDGRSANTIEDIRTGIDSLFSRLTTDFPNTPILVMLPGRTETVPNSLLLSQIREHIITHSRNTSDIYIVGNAASFHYGGYYDTDNLHWNMNGNNEAGKMFNRWFTNSSYSKWSRAVITNHFDTLTTARKNLIDTFITSQISNGNYWKLENLTVFKTSNAANVGVDWALMSQMQKVGTIVFTENNNVSTDGSTNYLFASTIPSVLYRATQTDAITGVKLKTRITASGVSSVMLGGGGGTGTTVAIQQTTTNVAYRYNDTTITTMADTVIEANKLHSVARNAGTKYYLKDTTVAASAAVSSGGVPVVYPLIGAFNNNGTISLRFAGEYEYYFSAKYSDFDLASFYTNIETLISNW